MNRYRSIKTNKRKILSIILVAAILINLMVGIPAQKISAAGEQMPTITYQGLIMGEGKNPSLLISNPDPEQDIDFTPESEAMAAGNTYFEYTYPSMVTFKGISFVGWWPKNQAVSNVSFEYFDGENWNPFGQATALDWQTPAGNGVREELNLTFDETASGSAIRIYVNETYHTWSAKCSMRLMKPIIEKTTEESKEQAALRREIETANTFLSEIETGTQMGQYPEEAVNTFKSILEIARDTYNNPISTSDDYNKATEDIKVALDILKAAQIPIPNLTLPEPIISLVNLNLMSGSTVTLVDGVGNADFDFGPGGDDVSTNESYLEFNYIDVVEISQIALKGWWPKDQALKNISIEYMEDGTWKSSPLHENIEIEWKTPAGSSGPEDYLLVLEEPITASKIRIKVNSSYHSWGSKINMRQIRPEGSIIKELRPVYDRIMNAQYFLDYIIYGNGPGEFKPESAVELNKVIKEVNEVLDVTDEITVEILESLLSKIESAMESFLGKQNPIENSAYSPVVSVENLTFASGTKDCLIDGQIATNAVFNENGQLDNAYIVFDYGDKEFSLEELTLISGEPLRSGMKNIDIEVWRVDSWVPARQNIDLNYRGTIDMFEGSTVYFKQDETPLVSNKFRIKINETYHLDAQSSIGEIQLVGKFTPPLDSLALVLENAQKVLEKDYEDVGLSDQLKILVMYASDSLYFESLSTDEQVLLIHDINMTVEQLENSSGSTNPSPIPSASSSPQPSSIPTNSPSPEPSSVPTNSPSSEPSSVPTNSPSSEPSSTPTNGPSLEPSSIPTNSPSLKPSNVPTNSPSSEPSSVPTNSPSLEPSNAPTSVPVVVPTYNPAPMSTPSVATYEPAISQDDKTKTETTKTITTNPDGTKIIENYSIITKKATGTRTIQHSAETTTKTNTAQATVTFNEKGIPKSKQIVIKPFTMSAKNDKTTVQLTLNPNLDVVKEVVGNLTKQYPTLNQTDWQIQIKIPDALVTQQLNKDTVKCADIIITIPYVLEQTYGKVDSIIIGKEAFNTAKKLEKELSYTSTKEGSNQSYKWKFDTDLLKSSKRKVMDMNMKINILSPMDSSLSYSSIQSFLKNEKSIDEKKTVLVPCLNEGLLPASAFITLKDKTIEPNQDYYLYIYDKKANKLKAVPSSKLKSTKDGTISVPITCGGDYVLLTKQPSQSVVTKMSKQVMITVDKKSVKKITLNSGKKELNTKQFQITLPFWIKKVSKFSASEADSAVEQVKISYKSNNTSVASVSSIGKITAKKAGKALISITITLNNGEKVIEEISVIVK